MSYAFQAVLWMQWETEVAFNGGYAMRLRQELALRAIDWAERHGLPHERTLGDVPSVLFREDDTGRHGNFHPASYRQIQRRPEWRRRLAKVHTTARRCLVSHDPGKRELDSSNSSDALLMSVLCHPQVSRAVPNAVKALLGVEDDARLRFGHRPRVPLSSGHVECTETDLLFGGLMVEAKLTETDFQMASLAKIERYRDACETFNPDALPRRGEKVAGYQLVRGALAAAADPSLRFCVICDERRPDLIDAWFSVLQAVRCCELRSRLQLITWQELARSAPSSLREWLLEKYGIQ